LLFLGAIKDMVMLQKETPMDLVRRRCYLGHLDSFWLVNLVGL
jgi:hypothetical protein